MATWKNIVPAGGLALALSGCISVPPGELVNDHYAQAQPGIDITVGTKGYRLIFVKKGDQEHGFSVLCDRSSLPLDYKTQPDPSSYYIDVLRIYVSAKRGEAPEIMYVKLPVKSAYDTLLTALMGSQNVCIGTLRK